MDRVFVIIIIKLIYRYRYICCFVFINDVRLIMYLCLLFVLVLKKGYCVEYFVYNSIYFNVCVWIDVRIKYCIFVYKCVESVNCYGVEG